MNFQTYDRIPFQVQAVEITEENLDEAAKFIGDVKEDDDGTRYILVDSRMVPSITRVYVGYFMTRIGKKVRCYSPRIFHEQFVKPANSDGTPVIVHGEMP